MTRKLVSISAAILLAVFSVPAIAANIAGNPGFETAGAGGAGDSALWTEFTGGAAGTMSVRDSSMPFAGTFNHQLVAIGSNAAGAVAGINQNSIADLGLASLLPGSTLDASFQWKASYGPGGVGFAVLRILNGTGAIVADSGLVGLPQNAAYATVTTPQLTVPAFGPTPNDVYAAFLEISVNAGGFDGSTATGFVDSVAINGTVVPEPASLSFLCLGGLGLLNVLRRR